MKEIVLMFMLALIPFAAGCGNDEAKAPQVSLSTEGSSVPVNTEINSRTEDSVSSMTENTDQVNTASGQNELPISDTSESLDNYMVSIKEQSDTLKTSLENDVLTQTDMNMRAQELYKIWDDALNHLWDELENSLTEEEFSKLREDQIVWIAEKEKKVKEAGKEVEGGSLYSFVVNRAAAEITEKRVYELYELQK